MNKYIISKDGKEMGPFSLTEVLAKITSRELELFDYIFDEQVKDWILLTEHQDVTKALKAQKPKSPPKTVQATESCPVVKKAADVVPSPKADPHGVEWFVMKGQTQFGPFAKGEVVRMLQERTIFEFDFIWNAGMKEWTRLAEVQEFSSQGLKHLYESKAESGSFLDRKHPREKISGKIVVHNNDEFWVADGKEISAGGLGLFISNSMIVPGQQVRLHIPSINGKEAFNAVGEVVSKKFEKGIHARSSRVEYGVRFLSTSKADIGVKAAG